MPLRKAKTRKKWQNVLRALKSRPEQKRGGGRAEGDGLDHNHPGGLAEVYRQYLDYLQVRNYSARTVGSRRNNLQHFISWCQERDLYLPGDITRPILESYQRWLHRFRQKNGKPLGTVTQQQHLTCVKALFKWLCRQNLLLHNPASELEMPRSEKRLPQPALTVSEVETILSLADLADPMGLRDRAIMEVFYSTAIRRSELSRLLLEDIGFDRKTLWVRQGKGMRDRVVPIGERALHWIDRYLLTARPKLETDNNQRALFLSAYGEAITPDHLSRLIAGYIEAANIGRKGSCHLFRHTCATLMLENGADIRYIQQLLGHANLETTSIYTEVTVRQLQKIHSITHPASKKTFGRV